MDKKERIEYLETLNNNQKDSIVFLQGEWDRAVRENNRYLKFLRDITDECEGSLLPWQYKWIVQRINHFLMEREG